MGPRAACCAETQTLALKAHAMEPMKPMLPITHLQPMRPMKPLQPVKGAWWPRALGEATSIGSQNDLHYAYFDHAGRLAVMEGDGATVKVYDTGGKRINGVSQRQGSGRTLQFCTSAGAVEIGQLRQVSPA